MARASVLAVAAAMGLAVASAATEDAARVMLNRASMSKFGVALGEVLLSFSKE